LSLVADPGFLHLNKVVESEGLCILGKVHKDCLGKSLEVVLDSVLHNVVDVDDQLLKFGKALMDVVKITVNVHGGPRKGNHTGSQLVFKVLKVRH